MDSEQLRIVIGLLLICIQSVTGQKSAWESIRLVGANSHYRGRVEVFKNGEWGTICDDSWSLYDGAVACRQLGFDNVIRTWSGAHFGEGSGPIHYDDMGCRNIENTLEECEHSLREADCTHAEDAGLECEQPTSKETASECRPNQFLCIKDNRCIPARWTCDGDNDCGDESDESDGLCSPLSAAKNYTLRLSGGRTASEGRVEILYDGVWGTACDDNWSLEDAHVVCRELGFNKAKVALPNAHFGQAESDYHIWLDEVQCKGTENNLDDCPRNPWGSHDCSHREDASVECLPYEGVTIKDAPSPTQPSNRGCGVSEYPVATGDLARKGSWPWQTSLRIIFNSGFSRHICSATLISRQWAVAAAHCFPEEMRKPQVWKLRIGEHNQQAYESTERDYQVQKIVIHPEFDENQPQEYDVTMIKLARPIIFRGNNHVNSVCMVDTWDAADEDVCFVTGWKNGKETDTNNNILRQHRVTLSKNTDCTGHPVPSDTNRFLCVNRTDTHDEDCTSVIDGGSPMVCIRDGKWSLVGIMPLVEKCKGSGSEEWTFLTKVASYIDWMKVTMAT